jgi:hypothetical protein
VPTWTVHLKKGPSVDLTRDEVLAAFNLFEEKVHSPLAIQLMDDCSSIPSLGSCLDDASA